MSSMGVTVVVTKSLPPLTVTHFYENQQCDPLPMMTVDHPSPVLTTNL